MVTLMLHNPHYREKSFDVGFITILSYLYSGALFLGVIEEFVNDALDCTLDSDDIEDEIDEVVDMVLTLIAGDTAAKLPKFFAVTMEEHIRLKRYLRIINLNLEDCSIIINKALVFTFVALADSTSVTVSAQSTISTNLETR
ncbi:hypothetical protein Tco_0151707 [Tanacetum coccineum]